MLYYIFTVDVPDLLNGYVEHIVKWDDQTEAVRLFVNSFNGENEVAGGPELDGEIETYYYGVTKNDGTMLMFRKIAVSPYAELITEDEPEEPEEPVEPTIYTANVTHTAYCGLNYLGSSIGTGTASSTVDQETADKAALALAIKDAEDNLVCTLNLEFEDYEVEEVDDSFTVSYSFETKGWVAFHDYVPDALLSTATRVFSFKDGKIHRHNIPTLKAKYYTPTIYRSHIEFIVTDVLTNMYTNLLWKTTARKSGIPVKNQTVDAVLLYNDTQCSGERKVDYLKTTRDAEGIWKFNDFRDLVANPKKKFLDEQGNVITNNINPRKPFFKKSRLYGDYLCVRLIFNNLYQTDIVLSEFGANNKISPR